MFRLNKLKNWAHSSIAHDKNEIETYQVFQDEINHINQIIEEFIKEQGTDNRLLHVLYKGCEKENENELSVRPVSGQT